MAEKISLPAIQSGHLTALIGRKVELQKLIDIVHDPSVRLVTILGSGGIGKTRLALELMYRLQNEFPQAIHFIPLAQLNTSSGLLPALAETLDIQSPPNGDLKQVVLEHFAGRRELLILDNFEHLLEGATLVSELLTSGPEVKVVVTSREKLDLKIEALYRLKGLALSPADDSETAARFGAVQLFLQKARQVRPDFSLDDENVGAVNQLCQLVDGNPLGILLAAAWAEHFSPGEILHEVQNNLDFLSRKSRDTESRHFSMRAVFNPSLERLDDHQKKVFRRLACFRGGFDLDAASAVAGADLPTLIALVERSLISRDPLTGRYELHELLRRYASEELAAGGECDQVLAAHTAYYLAFVHEREAALISPAQNKALDAIQTDFENIRQAYSNAVGKRDFDAVRTILPGIYKFCDMRSRAYEGEALFRQAREGLAPRDGEAPHPAWSLALLSWYDMRTYGQPFEHFDEIPSWTHDCLEEAESRSDAQAIAASQVLLGALAEDADKFTTAIGHYKKAMQAYPLLDDAYWVNMRIGLCHLSAQEYPEAIRAFQVSLKRGKETGEKLKQAWAQVNIGDALLCQNDPPEARCFLENAYGLFQEIGNRFGLVWSNFSLGKVAIQSGDNERAKELIETAGRIARDLHAMTWVGKTEALLQELETAGSRPVKRVKAEDDDALSGRELEILQLLKSEMSGPEIAAKLVVSLNTVRFHTRNIYQKLGVNTRLEAIRRARELGL